MAINKLKIMYNTNTRKYLRQATESWKRNIIDKAGKTCFITGKKQKNNNGVYLTVHHSEVSFESIVKQAHDALGIKYRKVTTDYAPGELQAVMDEIQRIHREENIEGICIEKSWHDRFHAQYGKDGTMDDLRETKRNYRKMNHNNRCKVYKSKRSA